MTTTPKRRMSAEARRVHLQLQQEHLAIAELWQLVERLSGAAEDEVRAFFATGMLLNMAAAMDLPQIAGDPGWALAHLRAQAEAAGAA